MAGKDSNAVSPIPITFKEGRMINVSNDGTSRGVAYNRRGEKVTFTTPERTPLSFSKEDVFNILLKSMKTV